jgi:transketolase
MRNTVVNYLCEQADNGEDIHVLTADLGFVLFDNFRKKHPDKFTNVGVAEANMIGLAAGMAMSGKRVYCYSMIPFLIFRTLDQIRTDLCAMRLPVTLIGVGCGFTYGFEGMTHHAIEDIAVTRALPNITVLSPCDPFECSALLRQASKIQGPVFFRLGGNGDQLVYPDTTSIVPELGKMACLQNKGDAAIIATGRMVAISRQAIDVLKSKKIDCRLYSLHSIKPLDESALSLISKQCKTIVSVEEHSVIGGIGTAVADALLFYRYQGIFRKIGISDRYETVLGTGDWLRQQHNFTPGFISKVIEESIE